MKSSVITSDSLKPSSWSGGTTTELFIFPQTANYKQRDFQFRLSTATVEVEESTFTSLPGISRKLMILSGSIVIRHKGQYTKQLNRFDIDEFEGDWETSSVGKCTDFNLMTYGNTKGKIRSIIVGKNQLLDYKVREYYDWLFIYTFSGQVRIEINNDSITLQKGDLLAINKLSTTNIEIIGLANSDLVFAEINIKP